MDNNRKRIGWLARRYASAVMIVALTAGSISLASFAEMGYSDSVFGVRAEAERAGLPATPSGARRSLATPSTVEVPDGPSLQDLLEQAADNENAVIPTWFQVALNGRAIVDSNDWSITLEEDQRIRSDTAVKHQLRVTVYPQAYDLGEGDSVTWNLGRMEGLSLDGEFREELVLGGGVYVGDVMLCYTDDSGVFLYTEFKDAVRQYSTITITYWYECGFVSVNEPTGIVFDLPGYQEPVPAVLIPENWDDNETAATPEETTPEESSPQETTPEETTPEESSPQETTPEETTSEESSPQETTPEETVRPSKGHGSGGDSGSDREVTALTKESITSAETVWESTTGTEAETEPQTEESQAQEQSPQDSQNEQSEGAAGESDDTESDEVLDINISFGTEVAASYGMQSQVNPNEILTYRMVLRNDSEEEIKDVRIRDYLPGHTSFVLAGDSGIYGVADGQQYITWVVESILPGEEMELTFKVKVFACTPQDYLIKNQVYWQTDDSRSVNHVERPENQVDFPMINIG